MVTPPLRWRHLHRAALGKLILWTASKASPIQRRLQTILYELDRAGQSFPRPLQVTIAVRDPEEFQRALESFRGYLDGEARKKEESSLASDFLNEFLKKRKE